MNNGKGIIREFQNLPPGDWQVRAVKTLLGLLESPDQAALVKEWMDDHADYAPILVLEWEAIDGEAQKVAQELRRQWIRQGIENELTR